MRIHFSLLNLEINSRVETYFLDILTIRTPNFEGHLLSIYWDGFDLAWDLFFIQGYRKYRQYKEGM